jgi:hypothetical protein
MRVVVAGLVVLSRPATGQRPERPPLEARPFAGVFVPIGGQRAVTATAPVVGLGGGIRFPALTLTSTFAWAPGHGRRGSGNLDIFQIDWGIESPARAPAWSPFAGGGLGVRIYDSREADSDPRHSVLMFGVAGIARESGRLGQRVEVRAHLSRFTGTAERVPAVLRADLTLAVGLSLLIP